MQAYGSILALLSIPIFLRKDKEILFHTKKIAYSFLFFESKQMSVGEFIDQYKADLNQKQYKLVVSGTLQKQKHFFNKNIFLFKT